VKKKDEEKNKVCVLRKQRVGLTRLLGQRAGCPGSEEDERPSYL